MTIPIFFGIYAVPVLISQLGVSQFGFLTLLWAISSYFGLFDFGLGRVVTQRVSIALLENNIEQLPRIIGSAFALLLGFGLFSLFAMEASAEFFASKIGSAEHRQSFADSLWWMAVAMPAIVLTTGYRGLLEAVGHFGIINLIRVPMGVLTYMGPVVGLWCGMNSLEEMALILGVGRIVACIVYGWFALRAFPNVKGHGVFDRTLALSLIKFGGWLSISSLVSPLMNYIDRFLLAALVSTAAVTYYVTPQELILRVGIIPAAASAVFFPVFATLTHKSEMAESLRNYTLLIGGVMAPVSVIVAAFAHPILALWINSEFANTAAPVLQILAIAAFFSGIAQVPYTMLQAQVRADLTAKLHLVELPIYVALIFFFVAIFGMVGAAIAWLLRIVFDMFLLYILSGHLIRDPIDRPYNEY